jgi:elongation factor Ts
MEISIESLKKLRELTSCGVSECRKALEESKGDMNSAREILKKRGLELAAKKGDRVAKEGRIESYVHMGNKLATMVEINCETDFVAKSEGFVKFCTDMALHIAAIGPKYVKREDVPADVLKSQANAEDFYKEVCLLEQPFVKDPKLSIKDYLNSIIASTGENVFIGRFIRFKVGEVE